MNGILQVEVPERLREALEGRMDEEAMSRAVLEGLAAEAVRRGLITERHAGHILGLSFFEREAFLAKHGIVHDYSDEEMREQRRAMESSMQQA